MVYRLMLCLGCLLLCSCASRPFGSNAPQLRLNTEMHTARIWRSAMDAQQRYLVTTSDDKTARIWSLETAELLQVLRAPIDLDNEGRLSAVAMSPDGETVAVGGFIRCTLDIFNCIYLFKRSTGEVVKRITWLKNYIWYLTFSADGQYLAVSLGNMGHRIVGNNGIRIYDTSNYQSVFTDKDYDAPSLWITFANDGRVITSSLDGYIRLYSKDFKLLKKRQVASGEQAYVAALSPQQDKIAIGFLDTTAIKVLSANDLSLLYSPDTKNFSNGNLRNVTWSTDGKHLFAGGSYEDATGSSPVLVYSATQDQKPPETWQVGAKNSITALRALNNGSLLVTTADPLWTLINRNGESLYTPEGKILQRRGKAINFRNVFEGLFSLSTDATRVAFGFKDKEKQPVVFDLNKLNLFPAPSNSKLKLPLTQASTFKISTWKNQYKPQFNGRTIPLDPYEHSRSLAISQNETHFLLGAEWSLRYFDNNGTQLWKKPEPSTVWGVNIAANNQVAVAALGDGTIRWYRLEDGEELLALFVHPEDQRWVLWTPQGYYTASIGGESLVGWHVNHGVEQAADFFEIGQFRSRFYRPDIITEVLPQLDVNQAISVANNKRQQPNIPLKIVENLPPTIEIIPLNSKNHFNSDTLILHYQINFNNSALKNLKVLMNGRAMPKQYIAKISPLNSGRGELQLQNLPPYSFDLGLVAENDNGIVSEVAKLALQYVTVTERGKQQIIKAPKIKGNLYVLAIGNSEYQDKNVTPLNYADNDARDVAEFMKTQQGNNLYTDVKVNRLLNASRASVLDSLVWLEERVKQHDTAIIFLAGHGFSEKGEYYFLPSDGNSNKLRHTAISFYELKKTLGGLQGKVLLFIDSCRSGALMNGNLGMLDIRGIANELSSDQNGVMVLTASDAQEVSYESSTLKHGLFTQALLDTLQAKTEDTKSNKPIKVLKIADSVTNRLEELLKEIQKEQNPTISIPRTMRNFKVLVTGGPDSAHLP